jgi:hypothetical protein
MGEFRGERDATRAVMRAVFSHEHAAAGGHAFQGSEDPCCAGHSGRSPQLDLIRSSMTARLIRRSGSRRGSVLPPERGMTLPMILASMATPLIGVGSRWYERPVAQNRTRLSFFVRTHRCRGEVLARECGHLFAVLRGLACTSSLNRAQRG